MYEKYKGRVGFVIIDLDARPSSEQQILVREYYRGLIPHVVVLDVNAHAVYNVAGEVDESKLSAILEKTLTGSR